MKQFDLKYLNSILVNMLVDCENYYFSQRCLETVYILNQKNKGCDMEQLDFKYLNSSSV